MLPHRCQVPQTYLFPFLKIGWNIKPLFRGYWHKCNGIIWASNHAHSTSDALRPVQYRRAILVLADGVYLATLDANATGGTVLQIDCGAVV